MRNLLAGLQPLQLDIIDDSALHAGHAGARDGGGHYRLLIVSEQFRGKKTMERHRLVHSVLATLIPTAIHALSISAKTPEEV